MEVLLRNVKFWGKNTLEILGISVAGAAAMLLFLGVAGTDYSGQEGVFSYMAQLYPYYLYIAGMFLNVILAVTYFQVYFSVLLTMNVTRKTIVAGIFGSLAGNILGIMALIQLIWRLFPGEISSDGLRLFFPMGSSAINTTPRGTFTTQTRIPGSATSALMSFMTSALRSSFSITTLCAASSITPARTG